MNPSTITNDLTVEILSRLPAKSVARFHCVSKQWGSIFGSPYFKELFLTRSSTKPRLLFAMAEKVNEEKNCVWRFFSTPQLENPYEKSSSTLVAAAEFHVKFSPDKLYICHCYDLKYFSIGYASGLIYLYGDRGEATPLICNPTTGRYAILPNRYTYRKAYSFFGFDPIDKQYKALSIFYPSGPGHSKILTFGAGHMKWRKINCPLRYDRHDIKSEGICINGVLYYLGSTSDCVKDGHGIVSDYVIVCFDIRSEKFTFIDVERFCRLINYKGKLAVIYWEDDVDIYKLYYSDVDEYVEYNINDDDINELRVWVLEDVKKQQWSKYAYTWTDDRFFRRRVSIAGGTASGEIVFSMLKYTPKQPFYVFYFNPERNTLQRVEIQGFGEVLKKTCRVCTFVNHVEDLNVHDFKQLKSVHPPLVDEPDSESD
ncbi:F-box family protein [Arabidopsis thaliana]|uniref:F-box protein At2g15640 n=1 Tax=Arabidopsis thaliana TaxID=3702 RepID=FB104_ARATH|nr:F-box family protein [Arabidopsis thaliana]Q9ZQF0.1 RecName: Full=F-box protein At2g15640 [Arabidopsis thaliana]AAD17408.1 hypothetical protein [Arabidopsis thaliana]AEC06426.1 F-box family protein [Arabidopsis thaliana]|eukprot:NP_179166.1 F-box family protein [Arabidopsis thaliana]